jgi:hypothetical protein
VTARAKERAPRIPENHMAVCIGREIGGFLPRRRALARAESGKMLVARAAKRIGILPRGGVGVPMGCHGVGVPMGVPWGRADGVRCGLYALSVRAG